MTNLEHLKRAECCLREDARPTLAHVVQDAAEEIAELRTENEWLQSLLAGFEWQRINAMSAAEVEKELLAEGYTKERLDAGMAKLRATLASKGVTLP
jgi:hypothetical protein